MKISISDNHRRGFALIIAMLAIFVLATMAATLAFSMKVETKLAVTANDDQRMLWLARSAVESARYGLACEATIPGQPYRSLNQWWATGQAGPNETNGVLVDWPQSLPNDHTLGWQSSSGSCTYKITDLDSYANINTASTPFLQQALTVMGVDADDIPVISDSIQDWVQSGDSPRIAGAKNDYYQSLNPPYNCKEAPIDDMGELLLVRGIAENPEIYYGTADIPQKFHHKLGFAASADRGQQPDYLFGLKDVFTPFSSGQININTANAYVLQMIPGVDGNIATNIMEYREGVNNDATDPSFKSVNQLGAAGISQAVVQQMTPYCGVMSYTWQVNITATIGQDTRYFRAILFQAGANVTVVNFVETIKDSN